MKISPQPTQTGFPSWVPWILALGSLLLASLGAQPFAGGWNDGSRLAAVESLADRHTFAIEDSIFCKPSTSNIAHDHPPYALEDLNSLVNGTRDKLLIDGHYYSDKPYVISVLMAGVYQAARILGLPAAADRPDLFCWTLTFLTSGLAYLLAILALHRLGRRLRLPARLHLLWLGSFALSTIALTYTRHVNNHILLLGVIALVCEQLVALGEDCGERFAWNRLALLGTLAGVGFNLDMGGGPFLLAAVFLAVAWRCRRVAAVSVFLLAAGPWVAAGLGLNQYLGRVWKPINMVPEYMNWPGSPFNPDNMTGYSRHGPFQLLVYALSLLLGRRGILLHNLPLLLLFPALFRLIRRPAFRAELVLILGWCAGLWVMYAVLSNNHGGVCCSVRWFVPFLAPGYWALALFLRDCPHYRRDFLVLSIWGALLSAVLWWSGPWVLARGYLLFPIVVLALATWWWCRRLGNPDRDTGLLAPEVRQVA
jgi:MFS family permease